jgi:hypothetical protein
LKKTVFSVLAATFVLGGFFLGYNFWSTRTVHAQSAQTCDATAFSGGYGYGFNGFAYDSQGNLYILAATGRMVFDGAGNVSGADSYSADGTVGKRTYTGTYTVNSDCTGSMTLQFNSGDPTIGAHSNVVAVNNAKEINIIETDTNFILSGTLKKQTQ